MCCRAVIFQSLAVIFASSLFRIFGKIQSFFWNSAISKGIKITVDVASMSMSAAAVGPDPMQ
jgi:hypothetical protein